MSQERIIPENAQSIAFRPIPPPPPNLTPHTGSILLFYQYQEPPWDASTHSRMLRSVIRLAEQHNIKGRGRIAPEGLNCTVSGDAHALRAWCHDLRRLDTLFQQTDFKFTDNIPKSNLFKSLSLRKTQELVAYGLAGPKAPSLTQFQGQHVDAVRYHDLMQQPNTVIIDVRNYYESELGNFQPPDTGAQRLDPHMRHSQEFPKWLADPKTQEKLHDKQVLMYCTGGIRCERATALLNQITATSACRPRGVYELQGGIERYMKTFPEGGFWKGKNYLFDRRAEQIPTGKSVEQVEAETHSVCAQCHTKWTVYRGKYKCHACGVPVIVCDACRRCQTPVRLLYCGLCRRGHAAPRAQPDLVGLKRQAEAALERPNKKQQIKLIRNRLFLGRLPFSCTKQKIADMIDGDVKCVHWMTDPRTGAFYGSCLVETTEAVAQAAIQRRLVMDKKKIRASLARDTGEPWPPENFQERETPPVGCC